MQRGLLFCAALAAFSFPAAVFAGIPTTTLNLEAGSPTGDAAVRVYACFSEAISGFDETDLQVTNGSVSAFSTSSAAPCPGSLYTFIVTASGDLVTVTVELLPNTVESDSTAEFNDAASTVSWDYDSSLGSTFTELAGRAWFDADQDGVRTSSGSCSSGGGDDCAPGVEADMHDVLLTALPYLADGSAPDPSRTASSTLSNSSGGYFFYFGSVDIGRWRISQTLPCGCGWVQTLPTTTDAFYDVTIEDVSGTITRNNYESALSYDFGSYDTALVAAATPLAAPTATPDAGTFTSAQFVALDTASSSATTTSILYTLDGTTPVCPATGELYAGAFSIASSSVLSAIACSDASTSTVALFNFVINVPPDAPLASPSGGSYATAQDITLSSASTTASIHYTLDGTAPICGASLLFSAAIPLSSNTTIRAVACGGAATSTPVEFSYAISIPAPSGGSNGGGSSAAQVANGPISDTIPLNAPPPAAPGSSGSGTAVVPTPMPQSEVLNAQTQAAPRLAALGAQPSTLEEPVAPAEDSTEITENSAQAAAAGLASGGMPPLWQLLALILALLLILWALWTWVFSQSSQ